MHPRKISDRATLLCALMTTASFLPSAATAQACVEPPGSSFRTVTLVTPGAGSGLTEDAYSGAMQMGIAADGRVFIPKMKGGQVRVYKPGAANTALVGTVPVYFGGEDGMLGIALDPDFMTNRWLYLYYSDVKGPGTGDQTNRRTVLSRFTVDTTVSGATGLGQLTRQKILLTIPRDSVDDRHAGGGLAFDSTGVLVIGTGDNSDRAELNNGYGAFHYGRKAADAQKSASNTNDLRGKVLRIRPLPFADSLSPAAGVGSTYAIPAGNLWERISSVSFNPNWNPAQDTLAKVRQEIYAMGARNPYRPRVDSRSGWIFWGDPGPDANTTNPARGPNGHDEWNLATGPGFFGWPYCNAGNIPYNVITSVNGTTATYGTAKHNCAAAANTSPFNTGIRNMPPAIPSLAAYTSGSDLTNSDPRFNTIYRTDSAKAATETAVGGPMYRFNPALNSAVKFPAYYEGRIFFFDLARKSQRVLRLQPDGTLPAGAAGVQNFAPTGLPAVSLSDMQFGPDGALYLLKFSDSYAQIGTGPGLYRVEFTDSSYNNSCYAPFVPTVGPTVSLARGNTGRPGKELAVTVLLRNGFVRLPAGYRGAEAYAVSGRKVWSYRRAVAEHAENVRVSGEAATGVLRVRLIP